MKTLSKYSVGTGDRFAHQAKAQLQACMQALDHGMEIVPVWNKSNREHTIIGSEPVSARQAADAAVKALGWKLPYFCDADHITSADRRPLSRALRLLHPRCGRLHRPARASRRHRQLRQAPSRADRAAFELAGVDEPFKITRRNPHAKPRRNFSPP